MNFPFAGLASRRPYPATGLSTERWIAEVPVQTVALADLTLTQAAVRILALFGAEPSYSRDRYPHAVAHDGRLYLEDGHTRVLRAYFEHAAPALAMRVYRRTR